MSSGVRFPSGRLLAAVATAAILLVPGCGTHHKAVAPSPSVSRPAASPSVGDAEAARLLERVLDSVPVPPGSMALGSSPVRALDGPAGGGPACTDTVKRVRWWIVAPTSGNRRQHLVGAPGDAWLWLEDHPPPRVRISGKEGGSRFQSLLYFIDEPAPYGSLTPQVVIDVEADGDDAAIRATGSLGVSGCVTSGRMAPTDP